MSKYVARIWSVGLAIYALSGCADQGSPDDTQSSEASGPTIEGSEQALSRCGPVPRRPWPEGCHFSCMCSGPVTGPYGEDPADYSCTGFPGTTIGGRPGGECQIRTRGDCAFELTCEDD